MLKGRATILFVTRAIPKGLEVDRVVRIGGQEIAS